MKTIPTERLTLRAFRSGDLYDFHEYAVSDLVGPNAGWRPHSSIEETRRVLLGFIGSDLLWAITENVSGKMIGSISIHRDRMRDIASAMRMGYSMNPAFWGKGYMPEAAAAVLDYAFEELNVSIVSVDHFPENERSRRVIEKCGFRPEGTIRRAVELYDGRVCDLVTYSMSDNEYYRLKF